MYSWLYVWCIIYVTGLLAGLRSCGIIVLLAELFTAESKTQVYGCLHEFLRRSSKAISAIGM